MGRGGVQIGANGFAQVLPERYNNHPARGTTRGISTLPLMLLIRDEAIRGKSWFSRFSANSPSIFAKPTDYDT